MDDTWSKMSRDSSGNLVADQTKFPSGIKSLAEEICGMGLKFGLMEIEAGAMLRIPWLARLLCTRRKAVRRAGRRLLEL